MSNFIRKVKRNQCRKMVGDKNCYLRTCFHDGITEADKQITSDQNKAEKNKNKNKVIVEKFKEKRTNKYDV